MTRDVWEETGAFAEKYEEKEKFRRGSWGKIIFFFCRKNSGGMEGKEVTGVIPEEG